MGFSYGLLDVLNKLFQDTMNVSKARSTLLQAAYFGAYFLVALPAGLFMNKYGYKRVLLLACRSLQQRILYFIFLQLLI
jgi:FHS family L-fucose permease-like MFS transporter